MADAARETNTALIDKLLDDPHPFSFFQAVHLLERYAASMGKIEPVGGLEPELESIRFRSDVSLASQISEIVSIQDRGTNEHGIRRFEMTTALLGLLGPNSPLPTFYTRDAIEARLEAGIPETDMERGVEPDDPARPCAIEFLDIFHHRLLSLLYQCWLKYRYYLQFTADGTDSFSQRMFSLIGMGTQGMRENLHLPPVHLLRYAGLITQSPRSAVALEAILSDYFEMPVRIEPCIGRWIVLDEEDRTKLGQQRSWLGSHFLNLAFQRDLDNTTISDALRQAFADHHLPLSTAATVLIKQQGDEWLIKDGRTTYIVRHEETRLKVNNLADGRAWIGGKILDRSSTFRIHLGPMKRVQFEAFCPYPNYGESYLALQEIVQIFSLEPLKYEVKLTLLAEEVPRLRLPGSDNEEEPRPVWKPRLGWNTWLVSKTLDDDVSVQIKSDDIF